MKVAIIGTGLIGGSLALALRDRSLAVRITGVESDARHAQRALDLGLVDAVLPLDEALDGADLIILAVPVAEISRLLPRILDRVTTQMVMDVGSTKVGVVDPVRSHSNRGRFVATHPMWGTEYSGPEAAVHGAFAGKACVICDRDDSDEDAAQRAEDLFKTLGMHLVYMPAADHDLHVAYVSHISHITSFALANTVLEKERESDAIFELASGGFESTVRLAKSNPATWTSIFMQNRENVLDVLNEHISQLRKFKAALEKEDAKWLRELMTNANRIKRIIK